MRTFVGAGYAENLMSLRPDLLACALSIFAYACLCECKSKCDTAYITSVCLPVGLPVSHTLTQQL